MSVTITREKGGRTHYAVSVDAQLKADGTGRPVVTGTGHVSEWNTDPEKAGRFPEPIAKHVAEHYNGRLNAGNLTFRDERSKVLAETEGVAEVHEPARDKPLTSAADAESQELFETREERNEFQRQAKLLGEEVEKLRAENARLTEEAKQQKKYADATVKTNADQQAEIADLKKKLEEAVKKAK